MAGIAVGDSTALQNFQLVLAPLLCQIQLPQGLVCSEEHHLRVFFRSADHSANLGRKQPLLTTWMVTSEKSVSQTISLNLAYLSWLNSIQ